MDYIQEYLNRSKEIIGERTPAEEKYDREVILWLEKGKHIAKAIAKANAKYPNEALTIDNTIITDVKSHYEYLVEHEKIQRKLKARQ